MTFSRYGSVRALISAYIANFWNEGLGGGHYQNLIGPFTAIGCGVAIRGDEATFVQDFQ